MQNSSRNAIKIYLTKSTHVALIFSDNFNIFIILSDLLNHIVQMPASYINSLQFSDYFSKFLHLCLVQYTMTPHLLDSYPSLSLIPTHMTGHFITQKVTIMSWQRKTILHRSCYGRHSVGDRLYCDANRETASFQMSAPCTNMSEAFPRESLFICESKGVSTQVFLLASAT